VFLVSVNKHKLIFNAFTLKVDASNMELENTPAVVAAIVLDRKAYDY
jgi:hypothetical protein